MNCLRILKLKYQKFKRKNQSNLIRIFIKIFIKIGVVLISLIFIYTFIRFYFDIQEPEISNIKINQSKLKLSNSKINNMILDQKSERFHIPKYHKKHTNIIDYKVLLLPKNTIFVDIKTKQKIRLQKKRKVVLVIRYNKKNVFLINGNKFYKEEVKE